MRHQVSGNRLNRGKAARRAMLRNMVTSLFDKERITTTEAKAKEARRFADRMITFAKRGDLNARRQAARFVNDPKVLQKLFGEIGPRYADRPGGYTRVMKLGVRRHGDDAPTAILELVEAEFTAKEKSPREELTARVGGDRPATKPEPEPAEAVADEAPEAEEKKED